MTQLKQLPLINYGELKDVDKINAAITAINNLLGGKLTHFDNPVIFMNGATGTSTAYVFNIGDTKLVFLAISFKATDLVKKGGGNIGKLPDSLKPTDGIRIAATQDAVIANENGWGDLSNLLLWCNAQNQNPTNAISGSVTYVASN